MFVEKNSFLSVLMIILITFAIYVVLCPLFIKLLAKLNWREALKKDNADLHSHKAGTYTSGGVLIVFVASVTSLIIGYSYASSVVELVTCIALFSFVGLIDDSFKIYKGDGLKKSIKMGLLILASILTILIVPLFQLNSLFTSLFALFIIVGTSNSVNLTDGIDGLASCVSIIVLTIFLLSMLGVSNTHWFNHLGKSELSSLIITTACVLGSCLGFLVFNRHPAKLFMGDTGSLALGGFIAMLSLKSNSPLMLVLIGIVFVIEAMSVIIQVSVFKWQGRRIFLRAPIHHHFEKQGWAENEIVLCFSLISTCAGLLALLL